MITKILLGSLYWGGGYILALLGACAIGFALCSIAGLINIFRYKWAWALIIGYAVAALVCLGVVQGIFILLAMLGDNTNHQMQQMILVGVIFPGTLNLPFIPGFITIALRQTSGSPTE